MRALITRPRENAGAIARALSERDIEPIQEPLLEIRATEHGPIELDGVQAILLTSAFGARELASSTERRDIRILAVGDATAGVARDAGFTEVASARGDAEALAALVVERLKPDDGALLHAGGRTVAGDLPGQLAGEGFEVRRVELYSALPAPALSIETLEALKAGTLDLVLFFSPRTAATFVRLVSEAGVAERCSTLTALCLSAQVAEAARGIGWRHVEIADRPEQPAMIALVDRWLEAKATPGETAASQSTASEPAAAAEPPAEPDRRPEIRWEPKPAPPPPQASGGRAAVGVIAVALLLLAIATGVLGYLLWERQEALRVAFEQEQHSRLPSAELTDLQGRIGSVEARTTENLTRIEQRLTGSIEELAAKVSEAEPDLSEVDARIEDLRSRLASVQAARESLDGKLAAVETATAQLGERLTGGLADIEKQVSAAAAAAEEAAKRAAEDRTGAMLLALNEIRAALADGTPFSVPVADLRRLGEGDPEIAAALEGWGDMAETGIPTLAQLTQQFKAKASDVAGRIRPHTGETWLDSMIERAGSVVRVRRVGEDVAGDTPEAVLARAEAAMDRGDLAEAAARVGELQGDAAAAFAEWLAAAKARLSADAGLSRLEKTAVSAKGAG